MSFLIGIVSGPRRVPCPAGCRGWRHSGHAVQATLWHELAVLLTGAVVLGVTWNGSNQVGVWTFMILWWMRLSARLNVFLGVPNLSIEVLPEHLAFLKRYLAKKPMNPLFPLSITLGTTVTAVLLVQALAPGAGPFEVAGMMLLATLLGLTVLEHWFMVLPIADAALWRWALGSGRQAARPVDLELGAPFAYAGPATLPNGPPVTVEPSPSSPWRRL